MNRLRDVRWQGLRPLQLLVMAVAAIAPAVIAVVVAGYAVGAVTFDQMHDVALGAGENPGMVTFGAMFLCSPVQWWTGRSQVRVRKYLGIVFYLLALSNGAMFVLDEGLGQTFSEPLLVAGSVALLLALPLFLTSNRWSQRMLGLRRWRVLHRLTYLVAAALVVHVALVGDIGPGAAMIAAGFVARIPAVRRRLQDRSAKVVASPSALAGSLT